MLKELHIENFAIIENLNINFSDRLVVFTGETGAGKSIIIDAVDVLLGGRTDSTMIRAGAERATIEALFIIPQLQRQAVHELLKNEDLLDDPDTLSLARELRINGRSTARINGHSASLALLRQLGEYLVDIHGQSEHLSLLRVSQHLGLLDSFAGSADLFAAYTRSFRRLQSIRKELADLRQTESEAARRIDMLNYQINEIESARLKADEEEQLKAERNRLANAEGLASAVQEALQVLEEGSPEAPAASELLGQASRAVADLARLDKTKSNLDEQAQTILANIEDLTHSLRDYLEGIEFNPRRLDLVEERLNLIYNLKRKYGKPGITSIDDVLTFAQQARQQLEAITHATERIGELEDEENDLLQKIGEQGLALSQIRHRAAKQLEYQLEIELQHLSMNGAHFQVNFSTRPDPDGAKLPDGQRLAFDASGLEQVEFLVAPNPGEGLKPLVKIASGGETSRLMLGIKNVLARADHMPTLIFDEIDQGIGGRVGTIVGQKLWDLGHNHQVLCVTHLPQLAAFADQHLHVSKVVQDTRTTTQVQPVHGDDRLRELAQMMGEVSEGTLHSARDLLDTVRRIKEKSE